MDLMALSWKFGVNLEDITKGTLYSVRAAIGIVHINCKAC